MLSGLKSHSFQCPLEFREKPEVAKGHIRRVEPQEYGFPPKKSELSSRNVQEHCRDGNANSLLTTILVFPMQ